MEAGDAETMSCRLSHDQKRHQLACLFWAQAKRCFYCLRTTFLPAEVRFEVAAVILGVPIEEVMLRMATREHLIKRQDGGTDQTFNIVMACMECNSNRGDRHPLFHVKACRQKHLPRDLVFAELVHIEAVAA